MVFCEMDAVRVWKSSLFCAPREFSLWASCGFI